MTCQLLSLVPFSDISLHASKTLLFFTIPEAPYTFWNICIKFSRKTEFGYVKAPFCLPKRHHVIPARTAGKIHIYSKRVQ